MRSSWGAPEEWSCTRHLNTTSSRRRSSWTAPEKLRRSGRAVNVSFQKPQEWGAPGDNLRMHNPWAQWRRASSDGQQSTNCKSRVNQHSTNSQIDERSVAQAPKLRSPKINQKSTTSQPSMFGAAGKGKLYFYTQPQSWSSNVESTGQPRNQPKVNQTIDRSISI